MHKNFFKVCLVLALFSLITANKLEVGENDCHWDVSFDYRGTRLGAIIHVPASSNSNIEQSEGACFSNGVASGTINFYSFEQEDEPMITTTISGEFTSKGISGGAKIDDILDQDGHHIIKGFETEYFMSFKDLVQYIGKTIEEQFEEEMRARGEL